MKQEQGGINIYKKKINKPLLLLLIFTLLLGFTTLFANQSYCQINDVGTVADIRAFPPELIGVGQEIFFLVSVDPPPPAPGIPNEWNVFHGFQINITRPDGSTEIIEPFDSDPTGSYPVYYTPDQVGNYLFEFFYPGETFDVSPPVNYLSSSDYTSTYVQEEPVIIKYPSVDVTISPDPVGVNQMVEFGVSFSPLPPTSTDVYHDFELYIIKPSGTYEMLGPFDSTTNGDYFYRYTPTETGNYTIQPWYWGEWFSSTNEFYFLTPGEFIPFIVQDSPVFLPLTINVLGSGSTSPSPGTLDCEPGDTIVTAIPNPNWNFFYWLLDGENVGTDPEYTVSMFQTHELVAVFEGGEVPPGFYDLAISVSGSGNTNPVPGITRYQSGTTHTITATPDPKWKFSYWLLDGENVGPNPNYRIQMDGNHELMAVFELEDNDPPRAEINSIEPSSGGESAVQGESISFRGSGYDDGYIVEYKWTSNIDGILSNSKDFSISSLSVGTHIIAFEVMDNQRVWSNLATQTLRVEDSIPVAVVGGVVGAIFIPSVGFGTYQFYYKNRLPRYPRTYFNKSPSSNQIKEVQKEKTHKEQQKEEEEKKKYKRRKRKGKPFLSLDIKLPQNVSKLKSSEAQLIIKNIGQTKATEIKIEAVATRGLTLDNPSDEHPTLKQGEDETFGFPFKVDKLTKKGVYTIRFNVDCKETSPRKRRGYARAVKIGLLTNPEKPNSLDQIKNWLDKNSYCWKEMGESCDKVNSMFAYDLLIISPELEMPARWVHNISTFVENGQSILLIDKIITSENDVLAETLGYSKMQFEPFKLDNGTLRINEEHSITKGFDIEDKIPVSSCWGNPCKQTVTTGKIVAEFFDKNSRDSEVIPAITYNEYGEGKTVHINFHAEEYTEQLDAILKNSIDWLI